MADGSEHVSICLSVCNKERKLKFALVSHYVNEIYIHFIPVLQVALLEEMSVAISLSSPES